MKRKAPPILVTGSHRSGTTWVGRTLAEAPGVAYIHEPLNLQRRPGVCRAPVNYWYTYISEENSQRFYHPIKATLEFRYSLRAELLALKTPSDAGRMVRDVIRTAYLHYIIKPRALVKDPFALFSAQWFANEFGAKILIMVRHPAAFVSSILRRRWNFPFKHWLNQESLLRDLLFPFASEIEEYASTARSLLDQGILLWRAIYYVVHNYQVHNPSWLIYRHEDISLEPVSSFAHMFSTLGLEFTPRVEKFIRQTTNIKNPTGPQNPSVFDIRRNSRAIIKSWQKHLSPDEIRRVREATEDVSYWFYSDVDWD